MDYLSSEPGSENAYYAPRSDTVADNIDTGTQYSDIDLSTPVDSPESTFVSGSDDSITDAPNEIRTIPTLERSESGDEKGDGSLHSSDGIEGIDLLSNTSKEQLRVGDSSPPRVDKEAESFVEVRQFDLGKTYDANISKYLTGVQEANEIILASPPSKNGALFTQNLKEQVKTKADETRRQLLSTLSKGAVVSESVVNMIVSENISGKFQDWYFLTEDCSKLKDPQTADVRTLLQSLGVSSKRLDQPSISDTDLDQFDTFCKLWPTEEMFRLLYSTFERQTDGEYNNNNNPAMNPANPEETRTLVKFFTAFILDRNVYQYIEVNPGCCLAFFQNIILRGLLKSDNSKFIEIYFEMTQNVIKRKFFLLYRLVKVLPPLKKHIVQYLFDNDTTKVVAQFNELFDTKNLQDLLYFILFILGTSVVSFSSSNSSVLQYFKNCIDDISTDVSDEVELSVIKGYIDTFIRVNNNNINSNR